MIKWKSTKYSSTSSKIKVGGHGIFTIITVFTSSWKEMETAADILDLH